MAPRAEGAATAIPASKRIRGVAGVLTAGLAAVAGLHLYWTLGGTWAVHASSGGAYDEVTTGSRAQAAVMVVLLVAGCLVVLARVGLWRTSVSERALRAFAWVLAAALLLGALVNFGAATNWERLGNGSVALVLAALALAVAASGGGWRRHRPHRTLPSH